MSGRVEGKVAFITGAARGQGRSHAVRLAEEGAHIIAVDLCQQIPTVPYPMATSEDLKETVRLVEDQGRKIVAIEADVRDYAALETALDHGVDQLGRLDIVSANAGISSVPTRLESTPEDSWDDVNDVNLKGAWHTCKASIPHLKAGGRGGSIILTSSVNGMCAQPNIGNYVVAKHGIVGLMRTLALELAEFWIRVNSVHPTTVSTAMVHNDVTYKLFRPDLENPTIDDVVEAFYQFQALPIQWVEAIDVSNALLFLASDEARYITGITLPVDGGATIK